MGVGQWKCRVSTPTDRTTSHLTRLSNNDRQLIRYLALPLKRVCCRFRGFTTTAYSLRVQGGGNVLNHHTAYYDHRNGQT